MKNNNKKTATKLCNSALPAFLAFSGLQIGLIAAAVCILIIIAVGLIVRKKTKSKAAGDLSVPKEKADLNESETEQKNGAADLISSPSEPVASEISSGAVSSRDGTAEGIFDDLSAITVESESEKGGEVILGGKRIYVMYNRSFKAKFIQADKALQARYSALKNLLLSYKKVKARASWNGETLYKGRENIAKFAIRGKTLSLYLALEPSEFADTKYFFEDASSVKRFAATPMRLKIKSDRGAKYAAELISKAAEKFQLEKGENGQTDYCENFQTTEALIKSGLIKILATGEVGTEIAKADFSALQSEKFRRVTGLELRKSVTVSEADSALSDEVAAALVVEDYEPSKQVAGGKKGIVNIDVLSANFSSGEKVTVDVLREKGLIAKNITYVKVLARGKLDKALEIYANEFSLQAVKMIFLTGGTAKRSR